MMHRGTLLIIGLQIMSILWPMHKCDEVACLNDDFEDETYKLLANECGGVYESFQINPYRPEDDGFDAPEGSTKYMTNVPGNKANCRRSNAISTTDGVRLTFRMIRYYGGSGTPPRCYLDVNDVDGGYVASNTAELQSSKEWYDFFVVLSANDKDVLVKFECSAIGSESLLVVDYIKITANDEDQCQTVFPTTPLITTPMPTTTTYVTPTSPSTPAISSTTDTSFPTTTLTTEITFPTTASTTEATLSTTVSSTVTNLPTTTVSTEATISTTTSSISTTVSITETSVPTTVPTLLSTSGTTENTHSTTTSEITHPTIESTTETPLPSISTDNGESTTVVITTTSPLTPTSNSKVLKALSLVTIAFGAVNFIFVTGMIYYLACRKRPAPVLAPTNVSNDYILPRLELAKHSSSTGEVFVQITGKGKDVVR